MEKYRVLLKQISNRDPVLILTKETEMLWFNIGQYEMEHCRTEYKQCVTVIVYHKEVLCYM